jgi:hypothetical protein
MTVYDVVLCSLYEQGYTKDDIMDFDDNYIQTFSPVGDDLNTKSSVIFKESGNLKIFNSTIEIDGSHYTTLTLTSWLRQIKPKLKYWIQYIIFSKNIDKNIIPYYQQYVANKLLKLPQKYNRKFEELRKIFYKNYILDIDIININTIDELTYEKIQAKNKPKKNISKMTIEEADEYEVRLVEEYIESRGLKLSIIKNVEAKVVVYNGIYRKPAVCFNYMCDFRKFRIIFESEKKNRFRALGKYSDFFEVRLSNNSDTLYVVEGEIEGITISKYINDDIVAIHNTNSLPIEYEKLFSKYKKVIVKIDKDRFKDNYKAFLGKHSNIIVDYKINDSTKDYNDLHREQTLTSDMIKKYNRERSL